MIDQSFELRNSRHIKLRVNVKLLFATTLNSVSFASAAVEDKNLMPRDAGPRSASLCLLKHPGYGTSPSHGPPDTAHTPATTTTTTTIKEE
ncbi:hypothetical protein E2C01_055831 [Portunus trituberculatus]|uniref:Uncharacterized protein n=1 Tax=Portunus trituberculatus TaxID=210409 RepID=A0A5B7GWK9_PORTR|nr:hypothetical protein [Portunus trituberculatus]